MACRDRRLLRQESTPRDLGSTISRKRAYNESAVEHFEKLAVEDPVWETLRPAFDDEDMRTEYQCTDLRFINHSHDVPEADNRDEATASQGPVERRDDRRRRTEPSKRVASEQRVRPPSMKLDGLGVRTHLGGNESRVFVFEYKAAHKVTPESVKSAVAKTIHSRCIAMLAFQRKTWAGH